MQGQREADDLLADKETWREAGELAGQATFSSNGWIRFGRDGSAISSIRSSGCWLTDPKEASFALAEERFSHHKLRAVVANVFVQVFVGTQL